MKKLRVLGISFALASCFLLAGCGNEKVLTCSINQKQSGLSMDQIAEITFNDDKVTNVKLTVDSKATSDTIKDNWDTFTKSLGSICSNISNTSTDASAYLWFNIYFSFVYSSL